MTKGVVQDPLCQVAASVLTVLTIHYLFAIVRLQVLTPQQLCKVVTQNAHQPYQSLSIEVARPSQLALVVMDSIKRAASMIQTSVQFHETWTTSPPHVPNFHSHRLWLCCTSNVVQHWNCVKQHRQLMRRGNVMSFIGSFGSGGSQTPP